MANPNRTVAAAHSRQWSKVAEETRGTPTEAHALAAQWKREKGGRVRVTPYKLGPRAKPVTRYMVRAYQLASA